MAFCGNCGTQVPDGTRFCPGCGAAMASATQAAASAAAPAAPAAPAGDAQTNRGKAILAYFGPLVLIPIFTAKDSPFARFHSNQGLVLFIGTVALSIVCNILSSLMYAISWALGSAVTGILSLLYFAPAILAVMGIINANKGETRPLPFIGGIKLLK